MYFKKKIRVSLGEKVIIQKGSSIETVRFGKTSRLSETGRYWLELIKSDIVYYMDRDYKIRGFNEEILFHCKPIKKIKYKRKRYKNG